MPGELQVLIGTAFLYWALRQAAAFGQISRAGVAWGLGNRDTPPPPAAAWVGRAERAARNLMESWPLYAALVLSAALTGKLNAVTNVGAWLFGGFRLAHAALFIAGVTHWRTLAYYGACIGMILIALQLVAN